MGESATEGHMRLMVFVVALAAGAMPMRANAGDWRVSGATDEFFHALDISRIKTVGAAKQAWIVMSYKVALSNKAEYSLSREEFDCERQDITTLATVYYDGEGQVMEQTGRSATLAVVPDSVAEAWFNAVCHQEKLGDTRYDSAIEFHDTVQNYYSRQ